MSEQLTIGVRDGDDPELVLPALHPRPAARPFLKWVGGKNQLLPALDRLFPADIPDYTEPFLGGGAVFFHLHATGRLSGRVTLADANAELVNAYCVVRDDVDALIEALSAHKAAHGREYYYSVREQSYSPGVAGAARMIYLNKTCFNGLYRVNARGQFNVPMGTYKKPGILDPKGLRRASRALQGVAVHTKDFRETIDGTLRGLIYADPPYVPLSVTASFTDYAPGGFGMAEQRALADCLRASVRRGVRFILSNSYTDVVLELYREFWIRSVQARRAVNSNGAARGHIDEAVVFNFEPPAHATRLANDRELAAPGAVRRDCAG